MIALALAATIRPSAVFEKCTSNAEGGNVFEVIAGCTTPPSTAVPGSATTPQPDPYDAYHWVSWCKTVQSMCNRGVDCPPGLLPYVLMGLKDGMWVQIREECRSEPTPTLTPTAVATAFTRIPLPHLRAIAQPAAKTLVNLDTIFHVQAEPLRRTVTLLGQRVELAITPTSYRWTWGDGTTSTTTTPGAAYPSRAVTHRYLHTGTLDATVAVTWTARWRTNNGPWADVPDTVTTTGPATTLRVVEAVPNLAGPG